MKSVTQIRQAAAARQVAALAAIKGDSTGMTPKQLAAAIGASRSQTVDALRNMRSLGLIVRSSLSLCDPFTRWSTPEHAEEAMRYVLQQQAARRRAAIRNKKKARARSLKRQMERAEMPIVQRWVGSLEPVQRLPFNSVFAYGQAMAESHRVAA
jgi:hypothetical protein